MSNLFILLKNSFINSTGINSLSNRTSNSKEKKKLMITTATLLLIAILICFYSDFCEDSNFSASSNCS